MSSKIIKVGAFGVEISIKAAEKSQGEAIIERMESVLPVGFELLSSKARTDHLFSIEQGKKDKFILYKGDEKVVPETDENLILERLDSQVRLTVAEFALGYVFVHSGAVGWKGKAIIIPANSFEGKTTMVTELVKKGAAYYSDEYAILDEKGLVYPFPKTLSIREDGSAKQTEYPVENFGGKKAEKPIPVGLVLVTKYKKGSHWKPKLLSRGEGVLEIISHTVPIRNDPAFSLNVLNKVVEDAVIVKSDRSEAKRFVGKLIEFFEENIIKK